MIFSHPTLTFSQKNHRFLGFSSRSQPGCGQVIRLISRRAPGYVLLALPERQHGASDGRFSVAWTRDPEKKNTVRNMKEKQYIKICSYIYIHLDNEHVHVIYNVVFLI